MSTANWGKILLLTVFLSLNIFLLPREPFKNKLEIPWSKARQPLNADLIEPVKRTDTIERRWSRWSRSLNSS